jgi:hypothetical protein
MTDFYSVLKTSIIRRNLHSPAARYDVYAQAREAMVRRLWSFDPPLSEDEIDTRIGLFDAAVERIEKDLAESLAAAGANHGRPPIRPQNKLLPPATVYREDRQAPPNGRQSPANRPASREQRAATREAPAAPRRKAFDEDRLAPDAAGQSAPRRLRSDSAERVPPRPGGQRGHPGDTSAEDTYTEGTYQDDFDRHAERFDGRDRGSAKAGPAVATNDFGPDADTGYSYEADPYEADRQAPFEDAAYYEYHDPESTDSYVVENERYDATYDARGLSVEHDPYARDFEPQANVRQPRGRRSGKKAPTRRDSRARSEGRRRIPILAIVLGVLAALLVAINAYVFIPIVMGSDPARSTTEKTPDDVSAIDGSGGSAARIASTTATAVEIPERNLEVAESLVIFNGSDPTVFEGSSNNPIHFDSDSQGGFARISSAVSAAGARAVIGPGLADRLAGQTVRVTLLARSSQENGAGTMRFAYQSGLAVSHWQNADLSTNYGTYGMIWRVPAADSSGGDYLLIEPGIPGDGTSTDIRMIKIDVLTS